MEHCPSFDFIQNQTVIFKGFFSLAQLNQMIRVYHDTGSKTHFEKVGAMTKLLHVKEDLDKKGKTS